MENFLFVFLMEYKNVNIFANIFTFKMKFNVEDYLLYLVFSILIVSIQIHTLMGIQFYRLNNLKIFQKSLHLFFYFSVQKAFLTYMVRKQ